MIAYTCDHCGVGFQRPDWYAKYRERGRFCSKECRWASQLTHPERFWEKAAVAGPDECWLWLGSRNQHGYGRLNFGGRGMQLAHRVAYELATGQRPRRTLILHSCDNPPCVNPGHLREGTVRENSADMVARGRSPRAPGERSGNEKLTWAAVDEIRFLYAQGHTQPALGIQFGINSGHISRIVNEQAWLESDRDAQVGI